MSIAGMSLTSCIYEDEGVGTESTIGVNTTVVHDSRSPRDIANEEDPFTIQFWLPAQANQLADPDNLTSWPEPYLTSKTTQPVPFYDQTVFDTGYPYPYPEERLLCATGYAPSELLEQSGKTLKVKLEKTTETGTTVPDEAKKGRYDFLACDLWRKCFSGSSADPFAQDKNKLYFRHLTSKLVFYADRDRNTMENEQFVRNVCISNVKIRVGSGDCWENLSTPSEFTWSKLSETTDFTDPYITIINELKTLNSNKTVSTDYPTYSDYPEAGYKTSKSEYLPNGFVLSRNASDNIPIAGLVIDSCYVCNKIADNGTPVTGPIQINMDISAELSFSMNFPVDDSTTDGLTYTHSWNATAEIKEVTIDALGNVTPSTTPVTDFKPGNEYRIYIHFYRTSVNLTALEMPWNYGGVHYITISGGGQTK